MEKMTAKFICAYRWQVAYDGRIMGDDYAYNTQAECEREIDNRLAIDARDAVKYNRPLIYTK